MKILCSLVLLVALCLPSCSMFSSPDVTPALQNQTAQAQIFDDTMDSMKSLIGNSSLDDSQKALLFSKLEIERGKFHELEVQMVEYLNSFGEVDWKAVAKKMYELYKEARARESS